MTEREQPQSGTSWNTAAEREAVVESAIQQAMREGAFVKPSPTLTPA